MTRLIWWLIYRLTPDRELGEFAALRLRYEQLNIKLMRKSAEASEAAEQIKRWRTEVEVLRDQRGHNLCHIGVPRLLKAVLGSSDPYPDPDTISPEEFAAGCVDYHGNMFPNSPVRLRVVPADQ